MMTCLPHFMSLWLAPSQDPAIYCHTAPTLLTLYPRPPPPSILQAVWDAFAARGVLISPMGGRALRFVTHVDVGDADVEAAVGAVREVCALFSGTGAAGAGAGGLQAPDAQ